MTFLSHANKDLLVHRVSDILIFRSTVHPIIQYAVSGDMIHKKHQLQSGDDFLSHHIPTIRTTIYSPVVEPSLLFTFIKGLYYITQEIQLQ